ncbi:MAG: hypothetical protein IPK52_25865 [Chloroflexi bacterium]|nr:hypothetical protein [Chloroflexota bacterium]
MKFNWKVAAAALVIIAAGVWWVSSNRSNTFSTANLSFTVGGGTVTVTNPSDEPVAVALVGTGSRSFTLKSTIDGASGNSTREGSGTTATQTYLFDLPAGVNEFSVDRGTNVQFVTTTDTVLSATVNPMNSEAQRLTLIVAGALILGALYFMSSTTGHQWFNTLRGKPAVLATVPVADNGQGRETRSYGDNRANK